MRTIEIPVYNHSDLILPENSKILNNVVAKWSDDYSYIYDDAHNSVKALHKFITFSKEGKRSWLDFELICDDDIQSYKGEKLRMFLRIRMNIPELYSCCPLTGMCYDETLLEPFRNFLNGEYKDCDNITLFDLLYDSFDNLSKDIQSEIEFLNSEEGILDNIFSNDREFYENGEQV